MTTVRGVCPDCNGHGFTLQPNQVLGGMPVIEECLPCGGTGEVDHELERGLKVTLQSGPDRYPFVVSNIILNIAGQVTGLWLLPGTEWTPERHDCTLLREINLRRDGVWREKGKTKKSGGIWTFGVAEEYRSREV